MIAPDDATIPNVQKWAGDSAKVAAEDRLDYKLLSPSGYPPQRGMNNFYLSDFIPKRLTGRKHRLLQKLADWLKVDAEFVSRMDPHSQMTTLEQQVNLWHLVEQVIAYKIPGAFVDLGCFEGQTSALLARALQERDPSRPLHLYDSFEHNLGHTGDVKATLLERFRKAALPTPVIHEGRFETTLSQALPPVIAFAQIDCGVGGSPESHREVVRLCLRAVWSSLAPGGVCVTQDYCDTDERNVAVNYYPLMKSTVDEFLAQHGVRATALVGGAYSHAFFRKPLS